MATSTKRPLPSSFSESDPPTKKHKINVSDCMNDVVFTVGVGEVTEEIKGVKAFFAAHSEVFTKLLYNGSMSECKDGVVTINDVTSKAFGYIKGYTHFLNPSLEYEHVIDILYAAEKYMIDDIIKQCKQKILAMDNQETFYLIMHSINRYAPATFEALVEDIMQCGFVVKYVSQISKSEKFQTLKISQVRLIVPHIRMNVDKYKTLQSYCKCDINLDDSNRWQKMFIKDFRDLIDFSVFDLQQLINWIGPDNVLENVELLKLMEVKRDASQVKHESLQQRYNSLEQQHESSKKNGRVWQAKISSLNYQVVVLESDLKKAKKKTEQLEQLTRRTSMYGLRY
eukprot:1145919_1